MNESDAKYCMSNGVPMEDNFKNYNGCRNCKYQPAPLMMCDWGYNLDTVMIICTRWEEKNDKSRL